MPSPCRSPVLVPLYHLFPCKGSSCLPLASAAPPCCATTASPQPSECTHAALLLLHLVVFFPSARSGTLNPQARKLLCAPTVATQMCSAWPVRTRAQRPPIIHKLLCSTSLRCFIRDAPAQNACMPICCPWVAAAQRRLASPRLFAFHLAQNCAPFHPSLSVSGFISSLPAFTYGAAYPRLLSPIDAAPRAVCFNAMCFTPVCQ